MNPVAHPNEYVAALVNQQHPKPHSDQQHYLGRWDPRWPGLHAVVEAVGDDLRDHLKDYLRDDLGDHLQDISKFFCLLFAEPCGSSQSAVADPNAVRTHRSSVYPLTISIPQFSPTCSNLSPTPTSNTRRPGERFKKMQRKAVKNRPDFTIKKTRMTVIR